MNWGTETAILPYSSSNSRFFPENSSLWCTKKGMWGNPINMLVRDASVAVLDTYISCFHSTLTFVKYCLLFSPFSPVFTPNVNEMVKVKKTLTPKKVRVFTHTSFSFVLPPSKALFSVGEPHFPTLSSCCSTYLSFSHEFPPGIL